MTTPRSDDRGRRRFLREGFARMVGPLADYLDRHLDLPTPRIRLRPPGALAEDEFLDTCYRCGTCARVCPADAIVLLPTGDERWARTPVINPEQAACVVCDGLVCTNECPSGALRPLTDPRDIAMGLAKVDTMACLRSAAQDCSVCVDRCPMESDALLLDGDGPPRVSASGCVGCGVCELACPKQPKAVVVHPR